MKGPRFPARGTTGSAMLIDLPVSFIASVDTMKESKDTEGQPLTDAQIVDDVNLSASLSTSYITVDTHYNDGGYLERWVKAIRATGNHVWFRAGFKGWGIGNGGVMTPTTYLRALRAFILGHPGLFRPGDIFDPDAEPENGTYWSATYGSTWSWQPAPPNAATDAFNRFLVASTATADQAFHQLHISGVITTVHSTSDWWAMHPDAFYPSTVQRMGNLITVDAYPDADTTDASAAAAAWAHLLTSIHTARPGVHVLIGEMGYSNSLRVDDVTQQRVLAAELDALSHIPYLVGVNYWVGAGTDLSGGYTHIFTGTSGAWSLRPAARVLSAFFGNAPHVGASP